MAMAQEGYLPLAHYKPPIPQQEYRYYDISSDQKGRVLVAQQKGLLQYDGRFWQNIATSSTPLHFFQLEKQQYILCKNGISRIENDRYGNNTVVDVYENEVEGQGSDLVLHQKKLYYLIGGDILQLNPDTFEQDTVYKSAIGFEDIFQFNDKLYAFEGNYLVELYKNGWIDLNLYTSKSANFTFGIQTKNAAYLAYDNGDFLRFDGESLETYSTEVNQYLNENYPVSGKVFGGSLVIATLTGGAIIIEEKTGKITHTIQYLSGLPDDEVMAIGMDTKGGLWLGHNYGLSRASFRLPFKQFNLYPGLDGTPETLIEYDSLLWVGTNEGLFYLDTIKDYETLEVLMKERYRVPVKQEENQEAESGFLGNLFNEGTSQLTSAQEAFLEEKLDYHKKQFRKEGLRFLSLRNALKEKEAELKDSLVNANSEQSASTSQYTTRTVTRTKQVQKLKNIRNQFFEEEQINSKITELLVTDSGLVAVANNGVFLIKNKKAKKIANERFIHETLYIPSQNILLLASREGISSISLANKNFIRLYTKSEIYSLAFDKNLLFATGSQHIYKFQKNGENLDLQNTFQIDNHYANNLSITIKQDTLYLLKDNALYTLSLAENRLLPKEEIKPQKYLRTNASTLWYLSNQQWNQIGPETTITHLDWLNIFQEISFIRSYNDKHAWVINNQNIYRLDREHEIFQTSEKTFITGIFDLKNELITQEDIKLEHDNNGIKLTLSTPDYIYPDGIRYTYFIEGIRKEWSEWSEDHQISFPYMPDGDYVLKVKAKHLFSGNEEELNIPFTIKPPYWRTWWFHTIEVAFFSLLILISIRLNRTGQKTYVTTVISFLTLILFIELLATIAENSFEGTFENSPIYTFAFNVLLALTITPLERVMNRFLMAKRTKKVENIITKMRKSQIEQKEKNS